MLFGYLATTFLALAVPGLRTDRHGDPLPEHALARLGTTRFAHGWPCRGLSLSPDAKILASAGAETVYFWDVATGKELGRVPARPVRPSALAFAPDGKTCAILDHAGTLILCDAPAGKIRRTWATHGDVCVRFSPGGNILATAGRDKDIRLWDAGNGTELRQLRGHTERVYHLAFTPDGKHLASAGNDSSVRIWDVATGAEVRRLQGHPDVVYGLAMSPDGKTLASCGVASQVLLWDWVAGREIGRLDSDPVRTSFVTFFPDGKRFLTWSNDDGRARVWDIATERVLRYFPVSPPYVPKQLVLSGDGKFLVTADTWVRFWNPETGKEIPRFGHAGGVVAFSPDGATVATAFAGGLSLAPAHVRLWDAATGRERGRLEGHQAGVLALAFRDGGRRLASYSLDRTIRLWETATQKELTGQRRGAGSSPAAFSAEAAFLVAGDPSRTTLRDAASGQEVRALDRPSRALAGRWGAVAASRDGGKIAAAGELAGVRIGRGVTNPGLVCVWDAATGRLLVEVDTEDAVGAIALSPTGELVAVADAGMRLRLWGVRSGQLLRPVHDAAELIEGLQFSPDGRLLAGAGSGSDVLLWEVATGRAVRRFRGHRAKVVGLAFAPDGTKLASGSWDGTTLLWDLAGRLTPKRELSADLLRRLWDDLADADPQKAYPAVWALAADPARSLPFLATKVRAHAERLKQIRRLIADLDSPKFNVRQEAMRALTRLGDVVIPALNQALAGGASLEVRRRVEIILRSAGTPSPEQLQVLRLLAVLDYAGTPEARKMLKSVAE